jgi:hypothetical protein
MNEDEDIEIEVYRIPGTRSGWIKLSRAFVHDEGKEEREMIAKRKITELWKRMNKERNE